MKTEAAAAKSEAASGTKAAAVARAAAYWGGWFFAWVLGLIVIGAAVGAVTFPIGGLFFETEKSAGELALKGARFMAFIFMIWAPAVALVACVMKAWRRNGRPSA